MVSLAQLWRRYPALRRAALAQGFLSVAFSAFWSTLAVMLAEHYQMGSAAAGCLVSPVPPGHWQHHWQAIWRIKWGQKK